MNPSGTMNPVGTAHPSMGKGPAAFTSRSPYQAYRSPFGPSYKTQPHFHGITARTLMKAGVLAGGFGGVAGFFALFFFAEVPKVRDDIMMKTPLASFFKKEVAPEDNPF